MEINFSSLVKVLLRNLFSGPFLITKSLQTRSLATIYMKKKKSKEKTRGKKLEKFIEFDLSTLEFERSENERKKL